LKKIETNLLNKMPLRGIERITKVFMSRPKKKILGPGGIYDKDRNEWILETEGINLLEVSEKLDERKKKKKA